MTYRSPLRVLAWPARRKRSDNPYSFLVQQATAQHGVVTEELTPRSLARPGWDIIHVHWPDMVLLRGGCLQQSMAAALILAALRSQQIAGAKLVWTVHNLVPHEVRSPRLARRFMNTFSNMVDGIISPSQYGLREAIKTYPALAKCPHAVVPIGSYDGEYPKAPSRSAARARLGIDDLTVVMLAFGQIRGYKNLPQLVSVFRSMSDANALLIIAGPPTDKSEVEKIRLAAGSDTRIRILAERIDDADVPTLFAASDHFIVPFSSILNSSSVVLALSYGCSVLVPALGGLPEVSATVGADWVMTFNGELTREHVCRRLSIAPRTAAPDLSSYDWWGLGLETAGLFRTVAGAGAR